MGGHPFVGHVEEVFDHVVSSLRQLQVDPVVGEKADPLWSRHDQEHGASQPTVSRRGGPTKMSARRVQPSWLHKALHLLHEINGREEQSTLVALMSLTGGERGDDVCCRNHPSTQTLQFQ